MPDYHDRLDIDTRLTSRGVIEIFRRALGFLYPQQRLLGVRLVLVDFYNRIVPTLVSQDCGRSRRHADAHTESR